MLAELLIHAVVFWWIWIPLLLITLVIISWIWP